MKCQDSRGQQKFAEAIREEESQSHKEGIRLLKSLDGVAAPSTT